MSGILKQLTGRRRRFATGGIPQVGMSDPRTVLPGGTPPGEETGRTYHPLADADYYTYGQTTPEHQFFSGSLPVAPLKPDNLPSGGGGGSSSGGGGGAGVLGDILQLAGAAKNAGALANMAGYDNAYTDAMKNPVGAAKNAYGNYQLNNNVGSGQYANNALDQAGFGDNYKTPDLATGLGAAGIGSALGAGSAAAPAGAVTITDLAGNTLVGSGAAGAAGASGAGAAGASGASGAGAAGTGTLAASGLATALPIAAIGWAVADAANKSGDLKSGATSDLLKSLQGNGFLTLMDPRTQTYKLADGRTVRADQGLRAVSEALRKGDRTAAQTAFESWVNGARPAGGGHARGGSLETGDPGMLHYATQDPKYVGPVRGKGTGRSDEIPARLSDGEYVMDAETVAMLGDGSTDAGARKLDELRSNLRKHKGKKLSRGKFSDNAREPMEYVK